MPKKQLEIPGTEAPSIPELEKAADAYVKARDRRMRLTEQEIVAKNNLAQVAVEHQEQLTALPNGDRIYKYEDEIVILEAGKINVKVKRVKDETQDEE